MGIPDPSFVATERFDASDGEKWIKYCDRAKIPGLVELVGLDGILCGGVLTEFESEDWRHFTLINKEVLLQGYFRDLDYLLQRVAHIPRKNILGLYRNSDTHVEIPPSPAGFRFLGYDLIDDETQISALTNCGGFPGSFSNGELNRFGLIPGFSRAVEVQRDLMERHGEDSHARCGRYAIWRLNTDCVL